MLVLDTVVYLYYLRPAEKALAYIEEEYQLKRGQRKPDTEVLRISRELKEVYGELPRWEDFTRVMGEAYNKAERLNLLIESASISHSLSRTPVLSR